MIIPNTVKSAMKVLSQLGVDMTNVHAAGGVEMMKAAREGLGTQAKLIAVTQLTSTSESQMQDFQNIQTSLQESVIHYAKKTAEAGLDWCCLLGSGSASHQAGYQSRFYLSDTGHSSCRCCSRRSKNAS